MSVFCVKPDLRCRTVLVGGTSVVVRFYAEGCTVAPMRVVTLCTGRCSRSVFALRHMALPSLLLCAFYLGLYAHKDSG